MKKVNISFNKVIFCSYQEAHHDVHAFLGVRVHGHGHGHGQVDDG